MFVAGPIILSYQLAIAIIWWRNRNPTKVKRLLDEDAKLRAERLRRVEDLRASWQTADTLATSAESSFISPVYTAPSDVTAQRPNTRPAARVSYDRPARPIRRRLIQ
jgi:hypothetical protein